MFPKLQRTSDKERGRLFGQLRDLYRSVAPLSLCVKDVILFDMRIVHDPGMDGREDDAVKPLTDCRSSADGDEISWVALCPRGLWKVQQKGLALQSRSPSEGDACKRIIFFVNCICRTNIPLLLFVGININPFLECFSTFSSISTQSLARPRLTLPSPSLPQSSRREA